MVYGNTKGNNYLVDSSKEVILVHSSREVIL